MFRHVVITPKAKPSFSLSMSSAGRENNGGGNREAIKPKSEPRGTSQTVGGGMMIRMTAGIAVPKSISLIFLDTLVKRGPMAGLTINAPHMIELPKNVDMAAE